MKFTVEISGAYLGMGTYTVGRAHTAVYNAMRWCEGGRGVKLERGQELTITVRRVDEKLARKGQ